MKEEEIRKRDVFNQYLEKVHQDVLELFQPDTFEMTVCPACGSDRFHFEFEKIGFQYTQCDVCHTLFVNPRPALEVLDHFYSNSSSTSFWVNEFFLPVAEVRREKIFKPRAECIATQFPELNKARIGDIGAGFGLFLEELKKIWPDAQYVAIEPSDDMAQICRSKKLNVIPQMLENVNEGGSFDMLTSFELFEHLYNPAEFLRKSYTLLKPNGYLVITTLNGAGFDIQMLWEASKSIAPPHHLNFFNLSSIKQLLESTGFEIVSADTPGKLDWDIVEGMYKNEGTRLGRFWENVVNASEEAKEELQRWITTHSFSSHMRIIAKK